MKKYMLLVLCAALMFLALAAAVSADQDGNANWCNMDKYGCYNTEADGSKSYIYFWSEEARAYFMGGSTAPYTNVVDYCYNCRDGRMATGVGNSGGISEAIRKLIVRYQYAYSHGGKSKSIAIGNDINEDDKTIVITTGKDYEDGSSIRYIDYVENFTRDAYENSVPVTRTIVETDGQGNSSSSTYEWRPRDDGTGRNYVSDSNGNEVYGADPTSTGPRK
ncbi:MAG: hypothetical protein IJI57_01910 [Flexilinea sp.]|nr:hypothetical protein [Flexilinea sp.]